MRRLLFFIGSLPALFAPPAWAQYDPPPAYYSSATGTGATLKAQLNEIIDQHTVISYNNREPRIETLDQDPNNSLNVICVYSGFSVPKSDFPAGSTNTEHLWPNSYGIDDGSPAYGDLFNLRPCNASVNSTRGNEYYDDVGGATPAHALAPECRSDATRWEPRIIEKGDLARAMFYMDTRYEADANDGFPRNLTLTDNVASITSSNNNMGKLSTLVAWHYADPPSTVERKRNHEIYTSHQNNRNPFVDRPEFVWTIFGTGPNDSRLYFGGLEPGDGISSATVDFGSVIIGAAIPAAQIVTLNKTGTTPTTLNITVSGDASSTSAGQGQTFVGGIQNRPVNVALASVAPVGAKAGIITIDNTDLTSAAAGQGSVDGNDTITVVAAVLDHSNASFAAIADQDTLIIDFGSLPQGGVVTLPFSIHNLESVAGFTAKLDIDSIAPAGDSATLYTDLAPTANIPATSSQSLTASFDTSIVGSFSATYVISVSDENLPGETTGSALTLTLIGGVIGCNAADANCDTVVDIVDVDAFVSALLGDPPCSPCAANLNNDAGVDGADIAAFIDQLVP